MPVLRDQYPAVTAASIGVENTFSSPVAPSGIFNLSLSGSWSATVWLQRSFDEGTTWHDVQSYTANAQDQWSEYENGVLWRFGVKTGGYASGTVVGRVSQ